MRDDPWGPVARQIEEYLSPYGVAPLLERAIERVRLRGLVARLGSTADVSGP